MAQNIITPAEVIAIAFSDGEYVATEVITDLDITTAIEHWIIPITGRALLDAVSEGKYADLKSDYIAPATALCTRLVVQPRLNVQTSQLGLTVPAGSHHKAADKESRKELWRALQHRAQAMRRRLSERLEQQAVEIEEYRSEDNILTRCSCDGGFVQIF